MEGRSDSRRATPTREGGQSCFSASNATTGTLLLSQVSHFIGLMCATRGVARKGATATPSCATACSAPAWRSVPQNLALGWLRLGVKVGSVGLLNKPKVFIRVLCHCFERIGVWAQGG